MNEPFRLENVSNLILEIRPLEIILAKKTTELVLRFHKNITKLVFLWPNMSQKKLQSVNDLLI